MAHDRHDRLQVLPSHSESRPKGMAKIMEAESDLLPRLHIDLDQPRFLHSIPEGIGQDRQFLCLGVAKEIF